jgi:hypothetical protein
MPAEEGGAAGRDRSERDLLDLRESVRELVRGAMRAHDVGQFQPGRVVVTGRPHG